MKWQCALLQRWLPEYPDGDLPTFWKERLGTHLERCPVCRAEAAALKEVEAALQATPAADPGPEFWGEFSREMHLKLVQAAQEGRMAPPPRSPWWGRLPYLVGASAVAGLLLWVAVGYLNPERPGPVPTAPMAKVESAAPAEKMAAAPQTMPPSDESQNFVYVKNGGGEEASSDDDMDDLDSTLSGMTPEQKESFLNKLKEHEKDGSCVKRCSAIAWA